MQAVAILITLTGLVVIVLGVINLIRKARGTLPPKAAAGKVLGIGIGLFILGPVLGAATDPELRKVAPNASSSASSTPTPSARAPAPAVTPASARVASTAKPDLLTLYRTVLATAGRCDRANSEAGAALQRSPYAAYPAARDAREICDRVVDDIREMPLPTSITGAANDKARGALQICAGAYLARRDSLDALLTVIDGDNRPSSVQEFKDQAERAQGRIIYCVAEWMAVAETIGMPATELTVK